MKLVRRDGERIMVDIQLIDTGNATQTWYGRLEFAEAQVAEKTGQPVWALAEVRNHPAAGPLGRFSLKAARVRFRRRRTV